MRRVTSDEGLLEELVEEGHDFFTGVPDSGLKRFLADVWELPPEQHVPATWEAEAVGIAAGASLAGRRPVVYLQNAGLGRAVHAEAGPEHAVLYMQGSMGLAPAIGLGMALATDRPVVVINGDASLLMALGSTHTIRDRAPATFFHYVLDNGCNESVGGQPS